MKTISEYIGQRMWFIQPSVWKRFHELRTGEELLGTIQQKGFFGMTWIVEIQNKSWEIYRPSCWRSLIQIRESGYEMPFAEFIKALTDPFIVIGRKIIPDISGFDFSPYIMMLVFKVISLFILASLPVNLI